ncbi:DUF6531 domain-containing protein [Terriglobus albidus]|uniref:DUF6531 domain-containing protein n=1 Tax=Terriglobus albidus TaxID=1592106 RepID=UPI00164EC373|nr:RHS repeat domain-containing protein [Terriglobus albidus]
MARSRAAFHKGPIADRKDLKGNGRIYLVQIGPHTAPYALNDFGDWLRSKYGLQVQLLSPMRLAPSAWDPKRTQYISQLLIEQMKREHSDLAGDPNAYFIGFTDADMYNVYANGRFTFTVRSERAAVISSNRMKDAWWQRFRVDPKVSEEHLRARLRRILLKDVGIVYWHLLLNNDATSVLQNNLDPDIPAEDIFASDLDPMRTKWGQYESEPCVFLRYSEKDGIHAAPGRLVRDCLGRDLYDDTSAEIFQLDLRLGLLVDKHMDFNLPDVVPIEFQRATRDGWRRVNVFGSGTHNYDGFLSSDDNIQISVTYADGGRDNLIRVPRWGVPLAFAKYVDTDYSGRLLEMRWHSGPFEHYELRRFDGEVTTYLPCDNKTMCYMTGYRNGRGEELKFTRDSERRLTLLMSPNKNWLHLSYDPGGRIVLIEDSKGHVVRYSYDERDLLTTVTYPSGEVYSYTYDGTQHLLTFSVAQNAQASPRLLLTNGYAGGRLAKQTLADGSVFSYKYGLTRDDSVVSATVRDPDGRTFDVLITGGDSSIVKERVPTN